MYFRTKYFRIISLREKNVTRKLAGLMYRVGPDRVGFLSEHLTVYPGSKMMNFAGLTGLTRANCWLHEEERSAE